LFIKREEEVEMGYYKSICIIGVTCFLFCFVAQNAGAAPDWKEKQKEMFARISVESGDVIDKSNWEKVQDLLPEPVVNWVQKGEWTIKVGEFEYDFDYSAEWYELSAKNKGKYGLGSKKEIIELATGKFPMFVAGLPFPNVDVKNDPDGATKLLHNNNLCLQMNNSYETYGEPKEGCMQWIGMNGHERGIGVSMRRFYYWNRLEGKIPNPNEYMHTTITLVTWPFDLSGSVILYLRFLDGRDDSAFAYFPAIRRVKRLSGANRSDPFMGADSCIDDGDGWSGHVESMKWTFIDEKIMLIPKFELDVKETQTLKRNSKGLWDYYNPDGQKFGYEEAGWTGEPWAFTNSLWVPREVRIVEAIPLDPYYAYGKLILYIDKLTRLNVYTMKYTKAGEYWKTLVNEHPMTVIPDPAYKVTGRAFNLNGPLLVVDERTKHAMGMPQDKNHKIPNAPYIQPRDFTPQTMRTWTK